MSEYQYQASNGLWIDGTKELATRLTNQAVEFDKSRPFPTGLTVERANEILSSGKELKFGPDWYSKIRIKPAPIQYAPAFKYHLDCGCTVYHRSHIMSASMGTSCTDCYDRMSN